MNNREWFDIYIKLPVQDLKIVRESFLKAPSLIEEPSQLKGLELAIVTIERNPDYSHMFVADAAKKKYKKEHKGAFVKAERKEQK